MRMLTLALVLLTASQNPLPEGPKPAPSPETLVTPSAGSRKEIARITKTMQGLWTLRELEWPHLDGVASEFRGFCLVSDNHLSFEVHIGLRNSAQKLNDSLLDSGLWRFEVVEGGRMILSSLIGTYLDKYNHAVFREAGTQCRYEVLAQGDQMVWRKEDGQRLVFARLEDGAPARVDAFGRMRPEKKDAEKKDTEEPPKEKDK